MDQDHGYLQQFVGETEWYNEIVLGVVFPAEYWKGVPHTGRTWLRNYIAGTVLYLLSSVLWSAYIYGLKRHVYFPNGALPTQESILKQICLSMKSMPLYSLLPTISEYMVENGFTRCYYRVEEVGWPMHILYLGFYLMILEFGIYWVHRELHDIKPLYKYVHAPHHVYNKQNTLSPFAGFALHPLDGILQAVTHVLATFVVPTHFFTHEFIFFSEAVWTTNIHDCIHGRVWPIMGAGYHTVHHITYRHNYGHFTIFMDKLFGTLYDPELDEKKAC